MNTTSSKRLARLCHPPCRWVSQVAWTAPQRPIFTARDRQSGSTPARRNGANEPAAHHQPPGSTPGLSFLRHDFQNNPSLLARCQVAAALTHPRCGQAGSPCSQQAYPHPEIEQTQRLYVSAMNLPALEEQEQQLARPTLEPYTAHPYQLHDPCTQYRVAALYLFAHPRHGPAGQPADAQAGTTCNARNRRNSCLEQARSQC